ncbi:rho GTPase-activating protein SYDE1 [Columba livia]|uniref:rho GTPase-activating protein SYDE1 n=1 Tax=Columba livia TaxID=8932 RepID=UPI0031BA0F6B
MAEPLLRRTFSRLRGRDRPKKLEVKDRETSPPSPDSPTTPEVPAPDPPSPHKQNHPPKPPRDTSDIGDTDDDDPGDDAANGPGDFGGGGRSPPHGSYLQSLERSSRRWVLGHEEPGGDTDGGATTSGDIWYNPIPEDDDPRGGHGKESPSQISWEEPPRSAMGTLGTGDVGGTREEPGAGRTQAFGKTPLPCVTTGTTPSPPTSPKKSRSLPKTKSPGTVRRLSLKMKKLPELRRKLSLRSPRPRGHDDNGGHSGATSPRGVITRYHLDTSVASPAPPPRPKPTGYLSDGDSPELPVKTRGDAADGDAALDVTAFRPYSCDDTSALGPVSGLVAVHLRGVRDLKPAAPSAEPRDYFCVLQVDSAKRARTALVPAQGAALGLNHNFNLELEAARHLKVMVFAWDAAARRNRLCGHGTVGLPHVFRDHRTQQLAVRLQPRGILYTKLTLVRQNPQPGAPQPPFGAETPSFGSEPPSFGSEPRVFGSEPRVFGVELRRLVERENSPTKVPLLIQKCVAEIERRGLKVVGLYRLCGSAAVKKELRDAFERDSAAVTLSERRYPDINVVTGVLKDFLRELPSPLIPPGLYRAVLGTMGTLGTLGTTGSHREATTLLDGLPEPEKATLTCLLDHLSLVASFRDCNRMTPQNLAVCFGPVLLARPPVPDVTDVTDVTAARPRCPRGPQGDVPVDFKCHLEVLHYLLRAWPAPPPRAVPPALRLDLPPVTPVTPSVPPLVTPRPRPRGPESPPSNRYAGDWSVCDPPGPQGTAGDTGDTAMGTRFGDIGDSPRLSLRDFDALIRELERELAQPIDVCL